MTAGRSAGVESRRQSELARAHERAAAEARTKAGNYSAAAVSERATVAALERLAGVGYHLLADRRWPGSRTANVDLVVVGPGGVFILDTKWWRDVSIASGRIYRGQEDVTEDIYNLADLGQVAETDLAEIGLSPNEVHPVVVLHGRQGINEIVDSVRVVGERDALKFIASHGQRHTPVRVDAMLARCLQLFPVIGSTVQPPAPVAVVPEPVLTEPVDEPLLSEEEISSALLDSVLASPVEDWMAFLHPDQAKLVRRSFNGPARIRGSAGTGKTVVGLHRAGYLARTNPRGRVLVTTFVGTLPAVLHQSMSRLAPDVSDRIEFTSVHRFARRILEARGVHVRLDADKTTNIFNLAWARVGRHGLGATGQSREYWLEEISSVIKGRGVATFDAYADLARTGRRKRLGVEQRRAVWDLFCAYQAGLESAGIEDFAGMILLAERALEARPYGHVVGEEQLTSVIVDEAQDLSCSQIRLLYSLVGDCPDGLTLIGDGQQSIYPGGYTLAEVGISLAGRGIVMDVNYRNTSEIIEFATTLVEGDEFADIEGSTAVRDAVGPVLRSGPEPVLWPAVHGGATLESLPTGKQREALGLSAMVDRVRSVVQEVGTSLGDVGVLAQRLGDVRAITRALSEAGVPVKQLADYRGHVEDVVKVGTIKRAKGLEFKQVLVCAVPSEMLGDRTFAGPDGDGGQESWARMRRELFVAMTRARDGLWVGSW
ncbi:UvrD-helicase domain-containing protein [Sanguibacter sp. 25GB23B1]|uniref:UvrD-helicase domain-containing protein n=1 Tax=unclassified Sanguibacter TaxID=2645534 RepID=UPI0032B023E8